MAQGGKTLQADNFVLLDGLRGLGAILVLVGHTMQLWGPFWAPSGAVIVDLFFLLSGFVIAYSYEPKFAAGMRAGEFMIHRVVRLYPLYLLGTLLGFIGLTVMAIGDADGGERSGQYVLQLIPQLFMLPAPQAFGSPDVYSLNVPAWTLFFELLVNLVYVLAYRWLRNVRVLAILVLLCAAGLAATVFTLGRIDAGSDWATFWAGFGRASFGFFAGVLTFRLLGSPRQTKRPVSNWSFVILFAIPVACFFPASPELRPFVDLILAMILGMPLLWISQSVAPPPIFNRLFTIGGRISYAIYILHQPFREVADRIGWHTKMIYEIAPLPGILVMATVLSLAYFAEKYYDRPVRRWVAASMKKRAARRQFEQQTDNAATAIHAE
ncbi:MAG: acyltransferase [Hyphomonadaceae bacterium]|nr:acyltransferase [Hyphomonadaceae bacterium]